MVQPDIRRHITARPVRCLPILLARAVRDVAGFISSLEKRSYLRQIVDKGLDVLKENLVRSQLEEEVQRGYTTSSSSFQFPLLGIFHESKNTKYPYAMF